MGQGPDLSSALTRFTTATTICREPARRDKQVGNRTIVCRTWQGLIKMSSGEKVIAPAPETRVETADARWRRNRGLSARLVWGALSLGATALFFAGIPARLSQLAHPPEIELLGLAQLGLSLDGYVVYAILLELIFFLGYAVVGLVISWRKFNDVFARFVALNLFLFGASYPPVVDALAIRLDWHLPVNLLIGLVLGFNLALFYVFPSGQFIPIWTRWLAIAWVGWNILWPFVPALYPFAWPPLQYVVLYGGAYVTGLIAQVYRYRRCSNPVQQEQTKWIVSGLIAAFVGLFGYRVFPVLLPQLATSGILAVEYDLARKLLIMVSGLLIPLTFGIAILRYRLWEIDLIINRTLVYVPLTAILAGLFAALITLTQKLFIALTGAQSDAAAILTTLVIVALFTPIKDRLQALVDKRFKHASESIGRLNVFAEHVRSRVSAVEAPQITRRLLEEVVAAFGAANGAAYLDSDGELKLIDTIGEWQGSAKVRVLLQNGKQGKALGALELGERQKGRDYTPREREALQQVASAVALAVEQDSKRHSNHV